MKSRKNMKKRSVLFSRISCVLLLLSSCLGFVSCGKDTKAAALEKFANRDMAKIYVAYNKFAKAYVASPSYAEGM